MARPLERIVFAGTPAFAATCLQALLDAGFPVQAAYTQPDRPAGRGKQLQASPVKQLALQHGLPVAQPANFRSDTDVQALAALQPDVLVVVAYGLLLPPPVLAIPRHGCINVHASLLPRWRGAAPVERAIEAGDAETGITTMQMDAGLDTGPMLRTARCAIGNTDTGASLRARLAALGADTLVETLHALQAGTLTATPQPDHGITYAHKLTREEAAIDWTRPAAELARRIRAFNDANPCWTTLDGERLRLWQAHAGSGGGSAPGCVLQAAADGIRVACGEGVLVLTHLQLPGARVLGAREILNGHAARFAAGRTLGGPPA